MLSVSDNYTNLFHIPIKPTTFLNILQKKPPWWNIAALWIVGAHTRIAQIANRPKVIEL